MQTIHITLCFHVLKRKRKEERNLHRRKSHIHIVVNTVFFALISDFCFTFSLVCHVDTGISQHDCRAPEAAAIFVPVFVAFSNY